MENYNVVELVGEGSFGKVYKARRRYTGQIVVRGRLHLHPSACRAASAALGAHSVPPAAQAIKFILKHGKSEKDIRSLRQEIEILRNLQVRAACVGLRRRASPPRAAWPARPGPRAPRACGRGVARAPERAARHRFTAGLFLTRAVPPAARSPAPVQHDNIIHMCALRAPLCACSV